MFPEEWGGKAFPTTTPRYLLAMVGLAEVAEATRVIILEEAEDILEVVVVETAAAAAGAGAVPTIQEPTRTTPPERIPATEKSSSL